MPQPAQPFDYAWLKGQAHWLASNAYQPSKDVLPPAMAKLGYDQYQSIRFRSDHALWGDAGLAFRLQFFHVGRNFTEPVHLYEVIDGQSREILYDPAMFEWDKSGVDPAMMKDHAGFAGFRVQFVTNWKDDVAAFLGASYFRAVGGDTRQYGLSARALAVDTAFPRPEEFPRFTSFWFERPAKDSGTLTLYALLDSPSIAGALRIQIAPGGTLIMNIDTALYPRKPIERFGIAPLTSMFFYGRERSPRGERLAARDPRFRRPVDVDRRRRVDLAAADQSCAIAPEFLLRRQSARLRPAAAGSQFRSLPGRRRVLRSAAEPVGRAEARPERRLGQGRRAARGNTDRRTRPSTTSSPSGIRSTSPSPGRSCCSATGCIGARRCPTRRRSAQTIATRTGIGGTVGVKRQYYSWHFAVDFAGGELGALAKDAAVEAVITASRGQTEHVTAHYVEEFNGYRALFDIRPTDDSVEPIDLRLYLRLEGRPLTETWIYQWTPPSVKERKLALQ